MTLNHRKLMMTNGAAFASVLALSVLLTTIAQPAVSFEATAAPQPRQGAATAIEDELGLDRSARRLIQQGLRNEGFDPGSADGLFGPRTRAAIRRWQEARGWPATGYLGVEEAHLLRAAAAPRQVAAQLSTSDTDTSEPPATPEAIAPPALRQAVSQPSIPDNAAEPADSPPAHVDCEGWNAAELIEMAEFFEMATASEVTACLASGSDLTMRTPDGHTPLHMAAELSPHAAVVEALLNAGADMRAGTELDGHTPLHEAAANANLAVLEVLLDAGGDIETQTNRGDSLLHWAATRHDNPRGVEFLLARGAHIEAQNQDGETPLHSAIGQFGEFWREPERGNSLVAIVETLVAAGANIETRNQDGETPLHSAIGQFGEFWREPERGNGLVAIVETLVAAGANIEARSQSGYTPLRRAVGYLWYSGSRDGILTIVEALAAAGANIRARDEDGRTPLHIAAGSMGATAVIRALLMAGASPDARDESGRTPLHQASRDFAAIEVLLRAGADPRARDENGTTPLHLAASSAGDSAPVETLLAAGADLEAKETIVLDGRTLPLGTPLFEAASNENLAVLEALLAAGASVAEARLHNGITVLHRAAWANDNPAVIELLLAAGADLEGRDDWGRTPLHRAAAYYDTRAAISALLAAGADTEARDDSGNTPLHGAASYANASPWEGMPENWRHAGDAIMALLDAGADPNARNYDDRTPWNLAQDNQELRRSDAYWRLNDARFEAFGQDSRRPTETQPGRPNSTMSERPRQQRRACEISGYPSPANVQNVGLNWCGSSVSFQRRAFALQAAGAWCAIASGSSSTPAQIGARHREINAACDGLAALQLSGTPTCLCPAGYRP